MSEVDDSGSVDLSQLDDADRSALAGLLAAMRLESVVQSKKICPLLDGQPLTLSAVAGLLKNGQVRRVCVMSGAGISVAAGIPDFRTPGTGLYDNLQKYNLPFPEAIFEMGFFRSNPKPFFLYDHHRRSVNTSKGSRVTLID